MSFTKPVVDEKVMEAVKDALLKHLEELEKE